MTNLNLSTFMLNTHEMNSVFGGNCPVTTTAGKPITLENGCTRRITDGFNDDDGDGKQGECETKWTADTITCPPSNC
jgi:hypothetical protein